MDKILIKNGRVFDGEKFIYCDVFLKDGIIYALEENIILDADFVYDASGKTVSAGLCDIHTHLKGISPKLYAFNAEMCAFPFGVTYVVDACGFLGNRELLNSFNVKNSTLVSVGIKENNANFEYAEGKLRDFGEKAIGIKVCFDKTQIGDSTIKPLREVVDFAASKGMFVMVHCTDSPVPMAEILKTLRSGDILTHAFHGGENNAEEDNFESIKEAKKRGIIIDAGLAGSVHCDFGIFKKAIACGAEPDVISTDITCCSAYKRGGRYGMTMCMDIAKNLGMSEEAVFKAVTVSAGKAIGQNFGNLYVGANADIAVFDNCEKYDITDDRGNNVKSDNGYRCTLTVSNGEIVCRA